MAGRIARPWFWNAKRAWYVNVGGRRVRLGRDKDEAYRRFHLLMAGATTERAKAGSSAPEPCTVTVATLASQYLADMERRAGCRTVHVARCYLKPFLAACGALPTHSLRKHHVETVVRQHGAWNATTENHVKARIVALFNWGVEQGLIGSNPVKGVRKPTAKSRGVEAVIGADEQAKLMDAAPPYLRDVLFALQQSGARPCEVLTVEAKDFDPEARVWVLREHKTAHATGKPRIVYLTPGLTALCERLAEEHPTGPLFRRRSGKPFPPAYYLARLVRDLRRRLGLREAVTPYGFRHGFATDALANGVPDAQVAELLGHSGTAMLHRHYSHLTARSQALKAALGRVR